MIIKIINIILGLIYIKPSFSQEGEDIITRKIFKNKRKGFFVDVGAHHPIKFSKTFYMYLFKNWNGINIDTQPGSMKAFKLLRKDDVSLEKAISDKKETLVFYSFKKSTNNTFLKDNLLKENKIVKKTKIKTNTLTEVLDEYLNKKNKDIDYINIDVEGFDYQVIKSLNLKKYKPTLIIIEDLNFSLQIPKKSKIFNYLNKNGYYLYAKSINSLYFLKKGFLP